MKRNNRSFGIYLLIVILAILMLNVHSCVKARKKSEVATQEKNSSTFLVTGYCNCGKCCNWRRAWFGFGRPIYDYGPMKGRPKRVGITASGTTAHHGTIAADPKLFAFGTVLSVPGYGEGVVEDIGGAIKDRHIDLWFPTHEEAKKWGKKWLKVAVIKKK